MKRSLERKECEEKVKELEEKLKEEEKKRKEVEDKVRQDKETVDKISECRRELEVRQGKEIADKISREFERRFANPEQPRSEPPRTVGCLGMMGQMICSNLIHFGLVEAFQDFMGS